MSQATFYPWAQDLLQGAQLGLRLRAQRQQADLSRAAMERQEQQDAIGQDQWERSFALRQEQERRIAEEQVRRQEQDAAAGRYLQSRYEALAPPSLDTIYGDLGPGGMGPETAPPVRVPRDGELERMALFGGLPSSLQQNIVGDLEQAERARQTAAMRQAEIDATKQRRYLWLAQQVGTGRIREDSPYYQQILAEIELRGEPSAQAVGGLFAGPQAGGIDPASVQQALLGLGAPPGVAQSAMVETQVFGEPSRSHFTQAGRWEDPRLAQVDGQMSVLHARMAVLQEELSTVQFQAQNGLVGWTPELNRAVLAKRQEMEGLQRERLTLIKQREAIAEENRQRTAMSIQLGSETGEGGQVDVPTEVALGTGDGGAPKPTQADPRIRAAVQAARDRFGLTTAPEPGTPEYAIFRQAVKEILEGTP